MKRNNAKKYKRTKYKVIVLIVVSVMLLPPFVAAAGSQTSVFADMMLTKADAVNLASENKGQNIDSEKQSENKISDGDENENTDILDQEDKTDETTKDSVNLKNEKTHREKEVSESAVYEESTDTGIKLQADETTDTAIEELPSDSAIVATFAELEDALTKNNGIKKIYLGADITATKNLTVSSSKDEVLFSGVNPLTNESYEYRDAKNVIYIDKDNVNFTFKDITIKGYAYWGPVMGRGKNIKLTYDGPQISHNDDGTVHYINCNINVYELDSSSETCQEIAEASNVIIEGDCIIKKLQGTANAFFWLYNRNDQPALEILPNSNVIMEGTSYFIYLNSSEIKIGENAKCEITMNGSMGIGILGGLDIQDGASFSYNHIGKVTTTDTVRLNKYLTVGNGSTLDVRRNSNSGTSGYLINMSSSAEININSPKRVILVNGLSRSDGLISLSGSMKVTTNVINKWNSIPTFLSNDIKSSDPMSAWNDEDLPKSIWNQENSKSIDFTLSSNNLILNEDYKPASGSNTQELNGSNFLTGNDHMLSMGSHEFTFDDVFPDSPSIEGNTQAGSYAEVSYTAVNRDSVKLAQDVPGGRFSFQTETNIMPDSFVTGWAQNNFLRILRETAVTEDSGVLKFIDVPENLEFDKVKVPSENTFIKRKDSDWTIKVQDTRRANNMWHVDASAATPLTTGTGSAVYTLNNCLGIKKDDSFTSFTDENILVYSGITDDTDQDGITDIKWPQDQGPYVYLLKNTFVKPESQYSTVINWTLVNGPG